MTAFDRIITYGLTSPSAEIRRLHTPVFISDPGYYGPVPDSLFAQFYGLAGLPIRRYAVWECDRALIELSDGTAHSGSPEEILPISLRRRA